jgi:predicted RND superfamily exporter protein
VTRRRLAVWIFLGGLFALGGLFRLKVDNSPEAWLDPASPEAVAWKESQKRFGPDEFLVFVQGAIDPFSPEGWTRQRRLAEALRQDQRFDSVADVPFVAARLGLGDAPPERPEDRERLARSPMLAGRLLGRDGKGAAVFARTQGGDSAARLKLLEDARVLADQEGGWTVAGPVAFNAELDALTRRDSAVIVLAMTLATLAGASWLLRSGIGALAILAGAGWTIAAWMAALGWIGLPISAAAAAGLPLLAVVGAENSLHVWLGAREFGSFREAARRLNAPLLAANATTALSLAALMFSPLLALRLMGWTLPLGVVAGHVWARWAMPALLDGWRVHPSEPAGGKRLRRCCARMALWSASRRKLVVGVAGALLIAGGAVLPTLKAETNIALQLSPRTRLARDLQAAGDVLGGTLPLIVEIRSDESDDPFSSIQEAARLAETLRRDGRVSSAAGPADFLALALGDGWDASGASRLLARATLATADPAESLFHAPTGTARLEILLPQWPSAELDAFLKDLGASFEDDNAPRRATGAAALMLKAQSDLLRSQLAGIGVSLALAGACLVLFFRDGRLVLAAIPSNLIPMAAAAGVLAVARWPLDFASAQLAAMIFGLAVNGTIFLAGSARSLRRATPRRLAVLFGRLGPAVAMAGLLTALAFSCAGLSELLSIERLGIAAAVAALSAAAADLILLPALLARPPKPRKNFPASPQHLQIGQPTDNAQVAQNQR